MCAASFDPLGRAVHREEQIEAPAANDDTGRTAVPPLLGRILDGTHNDAPAATDPALWKKLCDVADRYRNQPLTQSPIVVELIGAALHPAVQRVAGSPNASAAMTERIAETLWNDPVSLERLQNLWNDLGQRRNLP